ncbi:MAG: nucleotidyltransferase domain-containing protein [Runella slithyformis]|nr:MAG: nucleotidyltransferase domain-containing protein [Runella slithyformis]TAF95261.1 MAG: nucleotidyltransferase domain-containing protein [Runella sp.]TAG18539.1 MAG: nucleotidyltransferase domain-containing protein [Cytophagales bacterium]TAG37988.1 MAG: nucleotidyltransferase domain-containing protein [Cytophagia bacterium]TAE94562.1 MAG: nucleotidyltransferase domain-containing protein [Runella slithyformis]
MTDVQAIIELAKDKLVAVYHPLAIYLFGSYAWGEPNKYSDLDFMIIVNDEDELERPESYRGYEALFGLKMATDLLINRKSDFIKRSLHRSTLHYKIYKEGIKLYGDI